MRPKQLLPLLRGDYRLHFSCVFLGCPCTSLHVHDTYLEIISKVSQNPFSCVYPNSYTQKCGVSSVKHHAQEVMGKRHVLSLVVVMVVCMRVCVHAFGGH